MMMEEGVTQILVSWFREPEGLRVTFGEFDNIGGLASNVHIVFPLSEEEKGRLAGNYNLFEELGDGFYLAMDIRHRPMGLHPIYFLGIIGRILVAINGFITLLFFGVLCWLKSRKKRKEKNRNE